MARFQHKIIRCFRSRCQLPVRVDLAVAHEGQFFCCKSCLDQWLTREVNRKVDFRPYRSVRDEFVRSNARDYMD